MATVYGTDNWDNLDYDDGVTDGSDVLYGYLGSDHLYGRGGNDTIYGHEGMDQLFGGPGFDQLDGGPDNDSFFIFNGEAADWVHGGDGIDHLRLDFITLSSAYVNLKTQSYRIGNGAAAYVSTETVTGTQLHDTIHGDDGYNELYGQAGNDYLWGGGGIDLLRGGDGHDYLAGGAGRDNVLGGAGNDTIVFGAGDGFDDIDGGVGTDTVNFAAYSGAFGLRIDLQAQTYRSSLLIPINPYQLTNVENVVGSARSDTIIGDGFNNRLEGMSGNDTLVAGLGSDYLAGGTGNDVYTIDAFDIISELSGSGIDTVRVDFSASLLDTSRFRGDIENLYLMGGANLYGSGNALDNRLLGNAGDNLLKGQGGNDRITGGGGVDTFQGGAGNDVYWVDRDDTVNEATGGSGIDRIEAEFGFNLATNPRVLGNVENLKLLGTGNFFGTGNALANTIWGNAGNNSLLGAGGADVLRGEAGNDTLNGSTGRDRLYGGAGDDKFVFNSAVTVANRDLIYDFNRVDDTIQLDNSVFTRIGAVGPLKSTAFKLSTQALDANDRIIYNRTTGQIFYDADGSGAGGAINFASLTTKPLITYADFQVI